MRWVNAACGPWSDQLEVEQHNNGTVMPQFVEWQALVIAMNTNAYHGSANRSATFMSF
jgi:hypothetical protein